MRGHRYALATFGALIGLLGFTALIQYVADVDFVRLNTLLMFGREWGRVGVVSPGRMGPPGSTCWTLIGIAFVLRSGVWPRARSRVPGVALVTLAIAALSIAGYVYGADRLYSLPYATIIAFQTATFIAAVSAGLLASVPERSPARWFLDAGVAGAVARRAVPMLIIVPFVAGWLRLRGERAGWYDPSFGTAALVLFLVVLLLVLVVWTLRAISRHESGLRQSQQRLTAVLESINEGFITLDRQWRYQYVNDAAARLIKRSPADLLGRSMWEVFPDAAGSDAYAKLQRAADERVTVEYEYLDPGLGLWFSARGYPTVDDGIALHFRDITKQKIAQEQEDKANRLKDEFLAMLAHELRNPLAPIQNGVQMLRLTAYRDGRLRSTTDMLDRQVAQLVRLVDDLVDANRLTRGRIELTRRRIDVGAVIHQAAEMVEPLFASKGQMLSTVLPSEPCWVDGDFARLTQVVGNILGNASKFSPRDGRVDLSVAREHDSGVAIRVRDAGIGITPEQLPHIFDLFMQGDGSLERSTSGLGIGLALVRTLVEMHGGTVDAHSDGRGHGSEFVVRLTTVAAPETEDAVLIDTPGREKRALLRRVLVVDDNKDGATSLATILSLSGHETETAFDGEEALRNAERFRPDVVLLDIGMPGLNGYEACQRIRGMPWGKEVLMIALTGWGAETHRQRSIEAGFDTHLVKPVDTEQLLRLLDTGRQAIEPVAPPRPPSLTA